MSDQKVTDLNQYREVVRRAARSFWNGWTEQDVEDDIRQRLGTAIERAVSDAAGIDSNYWGDRLRVERGSRIEATINSAAAALVARIDQHLFDHPVNLTASERKSVDAAYRKAYVERLKQRAGELAAQEVDAITEEEVLGLLRSEEEGL